MQTETDSSVPLFPALEREAAIRNGEQQLTIEQNGAEGPMPRPELDADVTEELQTALERAIQWFEILQEQREKTNQLLREFMAEAGQRVEAAGSNHAELQQIREHCERLERLLGAVQILLSRYRTGSPLAVWQAERATQEDQQKGKKA